MNAIIIGIVVKNYLAKQLANGFSYNSKIGKVIEDHKREVESLFPCSSEIQHMPYRKCAFVCHTAWVVVHAVTKVYSFKLPHKVIMTFPEGMEFYYIYYSLCNNQKYRRFLQTTTPQD
uniref:Uncharacterized protein n=1 Tax=Glossina pallidipes TaxID=7398 RepID=A0A1A9ZVY8_GLOPL